MIQVIVKILYPFGSSLDYTVTSTENFCFKIQVPGWAQESTQSTISVNGKSPIMLNPLSETSLQAVEVCSDKAKAGTFINNRDNQLLARTNKITVNLDMPVQIETRTNGAVAIMRGPLNFAIELSFNQTTTIGLRYPHSQQPD